MEVVGQEIRYDAKISFVFRSVQNLNMVAREYIYVPKDVEDASCTCPRLQVGREMLIMGVYELDNGMLKLLLDEDSYTRPYTFNHIKQLTNIQNKAKCDDSKRL